MIPSSVVTILVILLIAIVAYYLITKFIEDSTLRTVALLVVGVILLLKLLGVY